MSNLPSNWLQLKLGDVVDYAKTLKVGPSEITDESWVLELEDIEKRSSKLLKKVKYSERRSKSTKNRFDAGDVLYGKLRPYLDKVIVASESGYCTTEIIPIKPGKFIDKRFLFYSLKRIEFLDYVSEVSHGLNMPRLGTKQGSSAPFILPPLNEQIRIANKLDSLLTKVDAAQARLEKIPTLLKRFRQSVLAAATSGELTREWRESNENEWSEKSIQALTKKCFDGPFGSKLKTADYTDRGVKVARLENIGHLKFVHEKETFISEDKFESLKNNKLEDKDILFSSFVDEEVRVCLFNERHGVYINKADCFCLRTDLEKCLPEFLVLRLACLSTYRIVKEQVHGATRPRINLKFLKSLELPIPEISEQKEIVRRVESLFALADTVEKQYNEAKKRTDRLTQSLLAKAFRGELVPQDPNDEPASELLKRIQAEREVQKPAKKTRRKKVAS